MPDPDEPELKIEDCKLNICGCRLAPSFLNGNPPQADFNIHYSNNNIQSIEDGKICFTGYKNRSSIQ
jgi:hypothetical protein